MAVKKKTVKRKAAAGRKPDSAAAKSSARKRTVKKAVRKKTAAKPRTTAGTPAKKKAAAKPVARKGVRKATAKRAAPAKKKTSARKTAAKGKAKRPLRTRDYKAMLLALSDRLSGQITSLKNDSLTRADEVNVEEDGTDAFDRQFALSLASSENEALVQVGHALQRIDEGTYGTCEECSGAIEPARLEALPFVRNCIACQSEIEKRGGRRNSVRIA